jgi:DNA adenine methylase
MASAAVSIPSRPVLRYHGGKWRLAPWILSFFPRHRVYVEPFGGAASVLLRKPRSHGEVYNDIDGDIVNVFRVLRDPATADRLRVTLELTPYARDEFNDSYTPAADPVERARRVIVRSGMGFGSAAVLSKHNTGFRPCSNRAGAVPAQDFANYPRQIAAFTERLRGVTIENRPALHVLPQHDDSDTLFYVDPPYPLQTRGCARGVRQKYSHELADDDHRRLAEVLHKVEGMVVLSGYPCDLYDRELYNNWFRYEQETFADGARARTEVVWLNSACHAALDRTHSQHVLTLEGR